MAFKGCEPADINLFKDKLRACLGEGNLKQGESIFFYWLPGERLTISKDAVTVSMQSADIWRRLLDVYIDPQLSVSPELVKNIEGNIPLL